MSDSNVFHICDSQVPRLRPIFLMSYGVNWSMRWTPGFCR